jgi:hypothetical protein
MGYTNSETQAARGRTCVFCFENGAEYNRNWKPENMLPSYRREWPGYCFSVWLSPLQCLPSSPRNALLSWNRTFHHFWLDLYQTTRWSSSKSAKCPFLFGEELSTHLQNFGLENYSRSAALKLRSASGGRLLRPQAESVRCPPEGRSA